MDVRKSALVRSIFNVLFTNILYSGIDQAFRYWISLFKKKIGEKMSSNGSNEFADGNPIFSYIFDLKKINLSNE